MRPTLSLAISIFTMVALTSDVNGYNSSSISDASHSFNTAPDSTTIKDPVYVEVTIKQKAEFPGGDAALKKYIKKNYKVPSVAAELRGRVIAQFIVEKDGSLSDIKILRDLGSGTKEEAIRMLQTMPTWIPAIQKGEKVRVVKILPIPINL